ncbi:MAG: cell division protein FtsZ [FCB group bacterium]|jgi:cell division protein FtsZ
MPIELDTSATQGAKIRVIGVGGGGGNALNNMIARGLHSVDFIAANTDKQALDHNLAPLKIHIGKQITRGLGAGSNPDIGKSAVEENHDEIKEALKDSDMIFVTCGMGGGTGTGGSPIVAKIAQELGALVVAIVTKPFSWEGKKRCSIADLGISELRQFVDALIVIPNQKLLDIIDIKTNFGEAFQKVDEVLYNATRGIADIISKHGVVNVDFADVKTVMKGMGDAIMGIGVASGNNRAVEATENALNSPLLDGISINGAQGVLVNITGGSDMTMHEVAEAVSVVERTAGEEANLIHGVVYNKEASEEVSVTVVATGFNNGKDNYHKTTVEVPFKYKTMEELPFTKKTFAETPANPFKQGVAIGGAGASPVMVEAPAMAGSIGSEILSSPRGNTELKQYDEPAYERRGAKHTLEQLGKTLGKIENINSERELETIEEEKRQFSNRPPFLRKILD